MSIRWSCDANPAVVTPSITAQRGTQNTKRLIDPKSDVAAESQIRSYPYPAFKEIGLHKDRMTTVEDELTIIS